MFERRNFIFSGLALAGCASRLPKDEISDDEYEIFNAVWNDLPCMASQPTELIQRSTLTISRENDYWRLQPEMTHWLGPKRGTKVSIPKNAIENFFAVNAKSSLIDRTRIKNKCVEFITSEAADKIIRTLNADTIERDYLDRRIKALQNGAPPPKRDAFAKTVHSISRFGFNEAHDAAIGGKGYVCGPMCAASVLVIAKKEGRDWRIADELEMWVS